ncbi:MAG: hypothetical protein AAF690_16855 [Acidobacteriota bacterium]
MLQVPTAPPCAPSMRLFGALGLLALTLGIAAPALAAEEASGVYVILDGSGSMWGQLADGTHKITAARDVLQAFSPADYAGREIALRVYGHRRKGDCSDSELVVPFASPDRAVSAMSSFADGVNPTGKTPIARSLRAALEDFGDRPGEIILVSDGIETCDDDPCALVREWRESDVAIKVHVVGLGLQEAERTAMQCISDAAGTEYRDAGSASELAAGLQEIRAAAPSAPLDPDWRVLTIRATNEAGESLRVDGTARAEGQDPIPVSSNGRVRVPPGDVEVEVGVRTRNGNLYRPVTRTVESAIRGETVLEVVVPEPPSVTFRFVQSGEEREGALVRAYQDDREVLSARSFDRAYVDPGAYEFRSELDADNQLRVSESFAAGDRKEVVFQAVQTVSARFVVRPRGGEQAYASNFELWQNGERAYKVHRFNGVQALPGIYELRMPLELTPFVVPEVELTAEPEQAFEFEVPVAWLVLRYQKADGSPMDDARVFLSRLNEEGRWVSDKITPSGERVPLMEGRYRAEGWKQLGTFEPIEFDVSVGEELEKVLRVRE